MQIELKDNVKENNGVTMVRTAGRTILRPEIELDIPSAANNLMINIETHHQSLLMSVIFGNVYWIYFFKYNFKGLIYTKK